MAKETKRHVKGEYKTTKKTMKQQYKDGDITKPYYKETMADLKGNTKGVLKNAKVMAKETKRSKTVQYDFDLGSSDMAFAADLLSEMASLQSGPMPPPVPPPPAEHHPPVYHPPPTYPYYYPYHPPVPHPAPHPAPHPPPSPEPSPSPNPPSPEPPSPAPSPTPSGPSPTPGPAPQPSPSPQPSPAPQPSPQPSPAPQPTPAVALHTVKSDGSISPPGDSFDETQFEEELAAALSASSAELDVDPSQVFVTTNAIVGSGSNQDRLLRFAITGLTSEEETAVINFFQEGTFTLDGFGTIEVGAETQDVPKPNDRVSLEIRDVCTDLVPAEFTEAQYEAAINVALGSASSFVSTSVRDIEGDSAQCPNPADTRITTEITVAAADLGNVLALLPTASDSIDLGGVFGTVSLGEFLQLGPFTSP